MKKGFTLMELMIVIIIVGVLATMGIMQYTRAIEKARSAEAKQFIGALRSQCAAVFMEFNSTANCNGDTWTGTTAPTSCGSRSYFDFSSTCSGDTCTFLAQRCAATSGSKTGGDATQNVSLAVNYTSGVDTWTYSAAYR